MGGIASCLGVGHNLVREPARVNKYGDEASVHSGVDDGIAQGTGKVRGGPPRQTPVDNAYVPTPRMLSLTTAAGFAARTTSLQANNPVERLCKETGSGLAVLDGKTLEAELKHFSQPLAVLHVAYVTPTPCASHIDTLNSSIGSRDKAPGPDPALLIQRSSFDGKLCMVFSTEQGSTAVGCVLANKAAVNALHLRDEQDILSFLARSFAKDPSLKVLFQDIIKRLLQGQLHTVNHFVPGDFGRNRYFLSMRIWPFAYRTRPPQSAQDGASARIHPDRLRYPADGGTTVKPAGVVADHDADLVGITPAMILELDVPYEGKELAARLQRDYMIISNIPSIVTMFDMDGRVLHQNRASVAYMGYLVGMERNGMSTSQTSALLPNLDEHSWAAACATGASELAARLHSKSRMGCTTSHNRLQQLFAHEPTKLQEIVMAVAEGTEWRGLIRMPIRMQWAGPDGEVDGEEANMFEPIHRTPNGQLIHPASSVATAAVHSSTAAAPPVHLAPAAAVSAANRAAATSAEAGSHRSIDAIVSPTSSPPPGFQKRLTAQLIKELQATVRLASEARARTATATPQGSQELSGNESLGSTAVQQQSQDEFKSSYPRPRLCSVAGAIWAVGNACGEGQLLGRREQRAHAGSWETPLGGVEPVRGWEERRPVSDTKLQCANSAPTVLATLQPQPVASLPTDTSSGVTAAVGAAAVAPAAFCCDLDAVGGASSGGASATFGDTALASVLSAGNAAAHAGTIAAAVIPNVASADAGSGYAGSKLDGGMDNSTGGSPGQSTGLREESLYAQKLGESGSREVLKGQGVIDGGGGSGTAATVMMGLQADLRGVHHNPDVSGDANRSTSTESQFTPSGGPACAKCAIKTGANQPKAHEPSRSMLGVGITARKDASHNALPDGAVTSAASVSGDVIAAAAMAGMNTAVAVTDSRSLLAGGGGSGGEVWGFWSGSGVNPSTSCSEHGAASAGTAVMFDSPISSYRFTVNSDAVADSTPPAGANTATTGTGNQSEALVARHSPLGRNLVPAANVGSIATNSTVVVAEAGSASMKPPMDGGLVAEVELEAMVPGQEEWSNHVARRSRYDAQDGGTIMPEENSVLNNTDSNFSIELVAHHLRLESVLQGGRSLSRGNTAGANGALAAPRALAYIDEETAEDERVEELSFLLPKVPPYATPYVTPRLTDRNAERPSAPAVEHAAFRASLRVPAAKGNQCESLALPRPYQRSPTQISDAGTKVTAALMADVDTKMHIATDGRTTFTSPRRCSTSQLPSPPTNRSGGTTGAVTTAATSSSFDVPGFPHLQPAATRTATMGRVHSNPPCTSRAVLREAAAADVATANSFPSSRRTTTYLQQTGLDGGKRIRSVLKALVTTDANPATVSSYSNTMTMGDHAIGWSNVMSRQTSHPQGNGVGAVASPSNMPSNMIPKVQSSSANGVLLEAATAAAAAGSDHPVTGMVGNTSRGLLPSLPVDATRWHEVHVRPCFDPMSSEPLTMVIQTDVTSKVRAEELLARVLEAEHRLLADIFPSHVVQYMTQRRKDAAELERNGLTLLRHIQDPAAVATLHDNVTVLFADIKGFTEMSKEVAPAVVMTFLNDLYTRFDSLTDVYGVYKVETIGDCYMVAGGLVARDGDGYGRAVRGQGDTDPLHAMRVVAFARAMLEEATKVALPNTGEPVQVRVGIHSGSVMSGVVGQKMPRFCLFGDTINTASRMESTGHPGAIHVSCATRHLLPPEEDEELWAPTGGVEVKGKGRMDTYLWSPQSPAAGRQRREKQQRAMLLGTLSTLQSPSASVSPPSSKRLGFSRLTTGGYSAAGNSTGAGAHPHPKPHQQSGSGASLFRLTTMN